MNEVFAVITIGLAVMGLLYLSFMLLFELDNWFRRRDK